jgi:predicted nucleic acid-binding protein
LKETYVLDACALLAFINKESGFDNVNRLMREAKCKKIHIIMNQINLFEVYYTTVKTRGKDVADGVLQLVQKHPITIIHGLTYNVMEEAARMKITYNMSMGDSIAAAESMVGNGTLVTSDHKDFGQAEQAGKVKVLWFR